MCCAGAIATCLVLAIAPSLLDSKLRSVRHVRAWALGARLLDDHGVILQTTDANCGHACLMTALVHAGRPVPRDLIEAASRARVGLTVAELAALGQRFGLPAAMLHVPAHCLGRVLDTVPLPSIALVGTHYVLVEGRPDGGSVTLVDPSIGRVQAPLSALERNWRGAMVTLGVNGATGSLCTPTIHPLEES